MAEVLLQTKFHKPLSRPALVPRPQLIDKLNQGLSGKLSLISAPAGFGKTTLVNEWAMDSDIPAAWLSLDEDDSDPIRFVRYVITSLQTVHADFGAEALHLLAQPTPPPVKTAVNTLINEISRHPTHTIFVLYDYHLI